MRRRKWIDIPWAEHLREAAEGDGLALKMLMTAYKRIQTGEREPWKDTAPSVAEAIGLGYSLSDEKAHGENTKQPRARRVIRAWKRLRALDLVEGESLALSGIVPRLGLSSAAPTLKMPEGYWNGWIGSLDGPASLLFLTQAHRKSRPGQGPRSGSYFLLSVGASLMGLSRPTTEKAVQQLEDHGLLRVAYIGGERWAAFTDPELLTQPQPVALRLSTAHSLYISIPDFRALSHAEILTL